MRKISKLFFVITALTFALSFGVVSNSPTAYATSGGGEGRCSDFSEASDREMCNDQYNECQAATGGNNCMERAVEYTQENGTQAPEGEPDVCTAGALGWIVCPAIDFLATMNDAAYAAVEALLVVNPVALENGGPLFQTWERFRDIANALFVVAILIIVFSQATSLGLSSYGVKKLLPRVIAAAILVNISFFLCQIAVDISNIVGVSIHSLFESFYSDNDVDIDAISFSSLITGILAGGALWGVGAVTFGSYGIAAAMASILPFLVTALFAVITALVVLIARQVIIILLVALSPLAFVALILPNTQKYFQMWQNTITTMLVMFPLVAALFAGSKLAANIVLTSPTSDADGGISLFSAIAAISMMFVPLFAVPFIVKFSGGTLGRLAGMINNPNKGPFDKLRKRAEETRDSKRNQAQIRAASGKFGSGAAGWARNKTFGAKYRRDAKRQEMYEGRAYSAKRADTDFKAQTLMEDAKFAAKAAGGNFALGKDSPDNIARQTAVARTQAQGLGRLNALRAEERKAGVQLLEEMGLSNKEWMNLQATGKTSYKDAAGNSHEVGGDFYQTAALAKTIPMVHPGGMEKLFANSDSGRSPLVREIATASLQDAYPNIKAKSHMYNSPDLQEKLRQGVKITDEDYEKAAVSQLSGLTKSVMSGQSDVDLKWALSGINKGLGTAAERKKLIEVAGEAYNDTNLYQNFTVDSKAAMLKISQATPPPTPGPTAGGSPGPSGPAPSGGSGGSPAAPRGPSGPPPAAPLGYAPAPQATVAPTPPAPQVVQAAPIQQTPAPAAPARNLPPAQPAQQATTASDVSRYTAPYSQNDLQAMGAGGIRTIIREVPQGTQGLSNADIAKIINATKDQNQAEMQDINQELRMERNRRRGGFDPTSGPKNPLP